MWGSVKSCCFNVTQRRKPVGLSVQGRKNGQAEAGWTEQSPVAMIITALEKPTHPGAGDSSKGSRVCHWSSAPLTSTRCLLSRDPLENAWFLQDLETTRAQGLLTLTSKGIACRSVRHDTIPVPSGASPESSAPPPTSGLSQAGVLCYPLSLGFS